MERSEPIVRYKNQWNNKEVKSALLLLLPDRFRIKRIKEVYSIMYNIKFNSRIETRTSSYLTIRRIVRDAENMDLIRRLGTMKKDRRIVKYELTETGKAVFELLSNLFSEAIDQEIFITRMSNQN